jgi:hypothetical protein
VIALSGTFYTAREAQELVRDGLSDPKFDKKPKIIGNCVRVFYAEGHHVDVPVFRKFDAGTDKERQELAGESGWVLSDPTEINVWFERRVQDLNKIRSGAGSQLRVVIRLLKRFRRSRADKWDLPNGLKLTMLVEECLPTNYARDDEAFYWLLSNLKMRLTLNLEVENRAQKRIPKDKLTKSANDSNMVELRDRVIEALQKLLVFHQPNCTQDQAREAWEWVFQTDGFFVAFDKDSAKAHALFSKAALINAGVAATDKSGIVVATTSGVGISNRPHTFYGEDFGESR